MSPPTSLGSAAGRVAADKATGCLTTLFLIAVGVAVYLALPESLERYFEIVVGGVYAAIGLVASRRGVRIDVLLPFLPLWLVGLAMAAVGCWKAWGRWGLAGAIPIGALAIGLAAVKIARALRAPDEDARP